ncbi:Uu.00g143180.m01.CDS01 [Anthostomella pinea]|uniref:Uu.00g143180.m01.CDS01 n=1 Tax=Anthostomella pinea TaxID=933095 RepID=A0AAI8VQM5_9PEZI|nr:Uu.00g143180.m01.CDS01 [Anthostomella pinea]
MAPIPRHPNTVNQGTHVIHFGGQYDSHLLLPVIPPVPNSYLEHRKPIKMSMLARRVKGWSDEKFIQEYTGVHAGMAKGVAAAVPTLRNYTQLVACPRSETEAAQVEAGSSWDCCTMLGWTSLEALWGSFQHPQYKATARSHVCVDEEDTIGILSQPFSNILFDPVSFEKRENGALPVVFPAKSSSYAGGDSYVSDLQARTAAIEKMGAGTSLLRYVLNRTVTPDDPKAFFAGTPFENADWNSVIGMEQYWFPSLSAAAAFCSDEAIKKAILTLPSSFDGGRTIVLAGKENVVVQKDIDF